MTTKWVDFFLIDSSSSDSVLDYERRITVGEGDVKNIKDLVNTVASKCSANNAKVRVLRLSGHGNENGGPIGGDWVSLKTLPTHTVDLKKLNQYFDKKGTTVIFDSCQTGTNIRLLSKLSVLWNGVKVSGFFDNQVPNILFPRDEEVKFTCQLKQCVGTHPDTDVKTTINLR